MTNMDDTYGYMSDLITSNPFKSINDMNYYNYKIDEMKKQILYMELNPKTKKQQVVYSQFLTVVYYCEEYLDYARLYLKHNDSTYSRLFKKMREEFNYEFKLLVDLIYE